MVQSWPEYPIRPDGLVTGFPGPKYGPTCSGETVEGGVTKCSARLSAFAPKLDGIGQDYILKARSAAKQLSTDAVQVQTDMGDAEVDEVKTLVDCGK